MILSMAYLKPYAQTVPFSFDHIELGPISSNIQDLSPPPEYWGVTHGTPQYLSSTRISMWAIQYPSGGGKQGEGVYRIVNIGGGIEYTIKIGINYFDNPFPTANGFHIKLFNDPLPTNHCGLSGCPLPDFSGGKLLYSYAGPSFTDNKLTISFTTYPGESWKYMVIYPDQSSVDASNAIWFEMDCLSIYGCPKEDIYMCTYIPGGHAYGKNIYVGSSFCSGTYWTNSSPGNNTQVVASQKIEFNHKTNIAVNPGNTFEAAIAPCTSLPTGIPPGQVTSTLLYSSSLCGAARPNAYDEAPKHDVNEILRPHIDDVLIYPNPANNYIKIGFLTAELRNIELLDVSGRQIKNVITSAMNVELSLSNLSKGIYLIKIQGSSEIIRKIVKLY